MNLRPTSGPALWCDCCQQKRVTFADRVCPTCRAEIALLVERLEQLLEEAS